MTRRIAYALFAPVLIASCDTVASTAPARLLDAPGALVSSATVHGPERFLRTTGKPNQYTRTISTAGFTAPFVLQVRSGDSTGAHRVSSATVKLDGVVLLGPSAFNQQSHAWDIPVTVGATATLDVTLASAPGSYLDITLIGTPVVTGTLFCNVGRPGEIPDLTLAIQATPAGGTVLVCDGTHTVVEATVDRPVTIRSENPGGATLTNDATNPGGQLAPAVVRVNNVSSGLVRFVDLTFSLKGRGIVAITTYDQVEVDSVTFTGVPARSGIGVVTDTNSVVGAAVNITNSHFQDLNIGVFALARLETNVRHSRFHDIQAGAITYSARTNTTPQNHSFGEATDNHLSNCRSTACIRVFSMATDRILIARNLVVSMPSPGTGVTGQPGISFTPLGAMAGRTLGATIEDNIIQSAPTAASPLTPAGWEFHNGIYVRDVAGVGYTIRRNQITNAHTGLSVGGNVMASENTIIGGELAFFQAAGPSFVIVMTRNDFVGQINAFSSPASPGDYRCNWWGSVSGPTNPPGAVPASAYTPWAMAPVAANPGVSCP